ncbi:phosphodiesterase YaeI [Rodentibacter pneumotropicus]|uniref:Phosphodiesterase YaeI n=1 Tax=Rodentibacter pneumotropicus TaxID=758 RepID=A0A3S4TZ14_9PAST|nr:phosphodiesterase YaeI [Rodentibacter pneumotropicus]
MRRWGLCHSRQSRFFGHQDEITAEIRQAGIILLKDQVATINDELVLIGRNDDLEKHRPSTEMLLKQAKQDLPIIVLDHRPSEVEIHSTLPFDLQVSGHTHKGQIFPANLITALTYRIDYGLEKSAIHIYGDIRLRILGNPNALGNTVGSDDY